MLAAFLLAFATGVAFPAWQEMAARACGTFPQVSWGLLALGGASLAAGILSASPARGRFAPPLLLLIPAAAAAGIGLLTAATGSLLTLFGLPMNAAPAARAVGSILAALPFLGLPAFLLGMASGQAVAARLSAIVPAAAAGVLAAMAAEWAFAPGLAQRGIHAAVLLVAAAAALRWAPTTDAEGRAQAEDRGDGLALASAACVLAAGAVALHLLAAGNLRLLLADSLGGVPLIPTMTALGWMLGGALGILFARWLGRAGIPWAGVALTLAAVATLRATGSLPKDIYLLQTVMVDHPGPDALLHWATPRVARLVLPQAVLSGMAFSLLPGSIPRPTRTRAVGLLTLAGTLGALIALAAVGMTLPRAGLDTVLRGAAFTIALLGILLTLLSASPRRRTLRIGVGVVGLLAVLFAHQATPVPRTTELLVERSMLVTRSSGTAAQTSWLTLHHDELSGSVSVARRGGVRRILTNGRFEMATASARKSHAMLAHVPLLLHAKPERALLLGAGNGIALAAIMTHPLEEVACVDVSRARFHALAQLGGETEAALRDPRLSVIPGDPAAVLRRADPFDVILSTMAGRWSALAARTSSVEFYSLARDRLRPDGLFCQWIPALSLSRDGLEAVLATAAAVFPRVEIWEASEGDLLLLASRTQSAARDLRPLLAGYGEPAVAASCRRSWIGDPVTLLSHFLVSDATVRRISQTAPGRHTLDSRTLTREETARRLHGRLVNPVAGLAAIRDDALATYAGNPGDGFPEALRIAVRARDLEHEGRAIERDGEALDAVEKYEAAQEMNPNDPSLRRSLASVHNDIGMAYAGRNAFTAAHHNFRTAMETDTTFALAFANMGHLLIQNNNMEYALSVTHEATKLDPENEIYWAQMGRIMKRNTRYEEAIPFFEKALQRNPDYVIAIQEYVDCTLAVQDIPDLLWGIRTLKRALEVDPGNREIRTRITRYEDAHKRHFRSDESAVPSASPDSARGSAAPDSGARRAG
ncbi:MAG: tetratricopeptide repeat protein [Gemmatimonadota bacterium]|jgi:spermidine synthase|nr:tetratricopeptide repeat protein [Gemmatimonadota bacterium]MDP6801613.1 tetratricopeptide repeat protein [Gemmatimonadota bacterium]MDP7030840.1 tetratricopeptide repeat protein [Gemmatimonadota bacterium]